MASDQCIMVGSEVLLLKILTVMQLHSLQNGQGCGVK